MKTRFPSANVAKKERTLQRVLSSSIRVVDLRGVEPSQGIDEILEGTVTRPASRITTTLE